MASDLILIEEDSINLLAWIDFCVENGLSFSKTIRKHLTDTRRARGNTLQVSNDQIKSKLGDLLQKFLPLQGGAHLKTLDVVKDGSQVLQLPKDIKRRVDTTVAKYEIIHAHMLDGEVNSSKRLLSSGSSGASPTVVPSSCGTLGIEGNSTPENISDTLRTRSTEAAPVQQSNSESNLGSQEEISTPKISQKGGNPEFSLRKTTSQSDTDCNHQKQQSCTNALKPKDDDITQVVKSAEQAVIKEKNNEIARIRTQWRHEVEELEEERRRQEETSKTLRAENIDLILARQTRERDGRDPSEAKLFELSQLVGAQARQIGKMRDLNTFIHGDPGHGSLLTTEDIEGRMSNMRSELESVMISRCITVPILKRDADLDLLVRIISDDRAGKGGEMRWLRKCAAKFNTEIVFRSLVLGALREWVFGTGFPDFRPMDMRLLRAYREIITTNDSWTSLRNLELAAYSKLVGRERFQQVDIPDRAKHLMAQVVKALSLLLPDDLPQDPAQQIITQKRPNPINEKIQVHLTELFEIALRLKAATVTTDYEYEFVVYPPGTPSKKDATEKVDDGQTRIGPKDHRQLLCFASIHRYLPDLSFPRDPSADALVQSNYFITATKEKRENQSDYKAFLELPEDEQLAADLNIETRGQRPQSTSQLSNTTQKVNPQRRANISSDTDDTYSENDSSGNDSVVSSWSAKRRNSSVKKGGRTQEVPPHATQTGIYPCPFCAKKIHSRTEFNKHLVAHPECLRTGKGHKIWASDIREGGTKGPCNICGKEVLVARKKCANAAGPEEQRGESKDHGSTNTGLDGPRPPETPNAKASQQVAFDKFEDNVQSVARRRRGSLREVRRANYQESSDSEPEPEMTASETPRRSSNGFSDLSQGPSVRSKNHQHGKSRAQENPAESLVCTRRFSDQKALDTLTSKIYRTGIRKEAGALMQQGGHADEQDESHPRKRTKFDHVSAERDDHLLEATASQEATAHCGEFPGDEYLGQQHRVESEESCTTTTN